MLTNAAPRSREEARRLVGVPGRVAELDGERQSREAVQDRLQPAAVVGGRVEGERELREHGAEAASRPRAARIASRKAFSSPAPASFSCVKPRKSFAVNRNRGLAPPARRAQSRRLARVRDPVEGRVDLVRVEERGHRGEPVESAWRTARIDDAFPVLVGPAGGADANGAIRPSAVSLSRGFRELTAES